MATTLLSFNPASLHWLRMVGPDAPDFLQRLTTVDIRSMQVGSGSQGLFLTAVGKVRAAFWLWRLNSDSFLFEVDGGADGRWLSALRAVIEEMTFAERFDLTEETRVTRSWVGDLPPEFAEPPLSIRSQDSAWVIHHGSAAFGQPWISVSATDLGGRSLAEKSMALPPSRDAHPEELEQLRILALSPGLDRELTFERLPLEIGLSQAVAHNKGCYPGQEVIERIRALGAPAKRLCLIQGTGPMPALAPPLTSVAKAGGALDQWVGLCLLPKAQAVDGQPVRVGEIAATVLRVAAYA